MRRRLIVAILLLAFAWQGPVLAYSASLAAPTAHGTGPTQCGGDYVPMTNARAACCAHGSGSCATTCAFSLGAAMPNTVTATIVRVPQIPTLNAYWPMVVEHQPAAGTISQEIA